LALAGVTTYGYNQGDGIILKMNFFSLMKKFGKTLWRTVMYAFISKHKSLIYIIFIYGCDTSVFNCYSAASHSSVIFSDRYLQYIINNL
jgi:hypothetical protein